MILLFLDNVALSSLGPFRFPLIVISVVVLLMTMYAIYLKLSKSDNAAGRLPGILNGLLVLGSFNLALGMIGQTVGIWNMIDAIYEAADINLEIVLAGIKISFGTTIYGLATFMVAVTVWLILTYIPFGQRSVMS